MDKTIYVKKLIGRLPDNENNLDLQCYTLYCILAASTNTDPKYRPDMHKCTQTFSYHTTSPENRSTHTHVSLKKEMKTKYGKIKKCQKKVVVKLGAVRNFDLKLTLPWDYTCQKKSEPTLETQKCTQHQKLGAAFANYHERER